jgi:hypothetical protein
MPLLPGYCRLARTSIGNGRPGSIGSFVTRCDAPTKTVCEITGDLYGTGLVLV